MIPLGEGLRALLPALLLCAGAIACLLLEVTRLRRIALEVAVAFVAASALALYVAGATPALPREGLLAEIGTDVLTLGLAPIFYAGAIGALVLVRRLLREAGRERAEYHALVLISTAGALLLAQARDLVMLFLALETLSIPLYVLCGFLTDRPRSVESALKYFLVGAFSSAFVAFGMALTYGAAGSLTLEGVRGGIDGALAAGDAGRILLARSGLAFLLVGFAFKIAAVPFHAWAGDVYQGAPTPVTTFLGAASKAAGMAALVRLLAEAFDPLPEWPAVLAGIAVLTLVVGNCVAMVQEDVKRLIAYSGVGHAGYMLVGLVAHRGLSQGATLDSAAIRAVLYYAVAYGLVTIGALAVVAILEREQGRDVMIIDFAGLAARRPALAAAMLLFLLSLAGMPPLAGFVGKLLVFLAAVRAGWTWLAIVAAAASIVGFYYYLRIVLQMYFARPVDEPRRAEGAPGAWVLIGVSAAGIVLMGLAAGVVLAGLQAPTLALAR